MRMSFVPKTGWSSECMYQIQLPSLSRSGVKVPGGVVGWGGVVETHFSVQLKPKRS